jgi:hypothetical protein
MIKVAQKLSSLARKIFVVHRLSKLVAADLIPELRDCHRLKGLFGTKFRSKELDLLRRRVRRRGRSRILAALSQLEKTDHSIINREIIRASLQWIGTDPN